MAKTKTGRIKGIAYKYLRQKPQRCLWHFAKEAQRSRSISNTKRRQRPLVSQRASRNKSEFSLRKRSYFAFLIFSAVSWSLRKILRSSKNALRFLPLKHHKKTGKFLHLPVLNFFQKYFYSIIITRYLDTLQNSSALVISIFSTVFSPINLYEPLGCVVMILAFLAC